MGVPAADEVTPTWICLSENHLNRTVAETPPISLIAVVHESGVNSLAPGQRLELPERGLIVVAGLNGSGKSGYARVVKVFAGTRGPEAILPNVFAASASPTASVEFAGANGHALSVTLDDAGTDAAIELRRIRVFDTLAAEAHLKQSNRVAWLPPVLETLGQYTQCLQMIAAELRSQGASLGEGLVQLPELESGPLAETLSLRGLAGYRAAFESVLPLTPVEMSRLDKIPQELVALRQADPARRAAEARQRAKTFRAGTRALSHAADVTSPGFFAGLEVARLTVVQARLDVAIASDAVTHADVMGTIRSPSWPALWSAAQAHAKESGHEPFPGNAAGSRCVLCQQLLDSEAVSRLEAFQDLAYGAANTSLTTAADAYSKLLQTGRDSTLPVNPSTDFVSATAVVNADLAARITEQLTLAHNLFFEIPERAEEGELTQPGGLQQTLTDLAGDIEALAIVEDNEASLLEDTDAAAAAAKALDEEQAALHARKAFEAARDLLIKDHNTRLQQTWNAAAIRSCSTQAASTKTSALAESYAAKVGEAFTEEVERIGVGRARVRIVFDKTELGVCFLRMELEGAEGSDLRDVLSEGERRAVALAAFFADDAGSGDLSTLVFDDPVTSLDQRHKRAIAKRIVAAASDRQVVVFTHDFSFVRELHDAADVLTKQGAEIAIAEQFVVRTESGAGQVNPSGGWELLHLKNRVGHMKQQLQDLTAAHRRGEEEVYRDGSRVLAGRIRDSWERLVEEVLLNGVVVRHNRDVMTKRLEDVTDITPDDYRKVDAGMTVMSRSNHDSPASDANDPPAPAFFKDEIDRLEEFAKEIRARRKKTATSLDPKPAGH